MQLGRHLHELWRTRIGLAVACLVTLAVALPMTYRVSLLPPKLSPKSLTIAAASTHVLVDTPKTTVLDLNQGTTEFEGMTNRAVLLGNVMASLPVREYIARRAGVPAESIQAKTPTTRAFPRPIADPQHRARTSDVVRSTDEYRLKISANPTVPILDIYAEAPTAKAAVQLANAAVDGLRDYMDTVGTSQGVPAEHRVQLEQLGRARGGVINGGVRIQTTILTLLFVFGLSAAAVIFVTRVRRGWTLSAQAERRAPADVERFTTA